MPAKKSVFIDVLVEGPGGDLLFKPVEIKKSSDVKALLDSKNSVIRENLKRELKLQKQK